MADLAEKRRQQLKGQRKGRQAKPESVKEKPVSELKPIIMPEAEEICIACGLKLKWVPINSRVRALVCANTRCNQYRNRLRIESSKPIK